MDKATGPCNKGEGVVGIDPRSPRRERVMSRPNYPVEVLVVSFSRSGCGSRVSLDGLIQCNLFEDN